jgi:hypothetical protein
MVRQKKADTVPVEGATITIDVDNFVRYRDRVSKLSFSLHPNLIITRSFRATSMVAPSSIWTNSSSADNQASTHQPPRCRIHLTRHVLSFQCTRDRIASTLMLIEARTAVSPPGRVGIVYLRHSLACPAIEVELLKLQQLRTTTTSRSPSSTAFLTSQFHFQNND